LRPEQIDAIAERRTPEFDDADDLLVYEFAHGYYQNHHVSDDIYDRVRARWGDQGVVDLAGLIGYYGDAQCLRSPDAARRQVVERDRGALSNSDSKSAASRIKYAP